MALRADISGVVVVKFRTVYQETIDLWGRKANINQAIQEMAELTVELTNIPRRRTSKEQVALEMADVEIMIELLKVMFNNKELFEKMKEKQIKKLQSQIQLEKDLQKFENR